MSSGNFMLRLGRKTHEQLKRTANAQKISLNELCRRRLAVGGGWEGVGENLISAMGELQDSFSDKLEGIAVFGSWARGDQTDTSDIDVLVVLKAETSLTRCLYRQVDVASAANLEVHLVTMPSISSRASGLWAEVAMDGIVLVDQSFNIHRYLSRIRRQVMQGKLVAKRVHGQNYWVHTEVA